MAGWMALAGLAAWAIDVALYFAGLKREAFELASLLVAASVPWLALTVVVAFLEMRKRMKP